MGMTKAQLLQLLFSIASIAGLPTIAKWCLDFVMEYIPAKLRPTIGPLLGAVVGFFYGVFMCNGEPQQTYQAVKDGIMYGSLAVVAHNALMTGTTAAPKPDVPPAPKG